MREKKLREELIKSKISQIKDTLEIVEGNLPGNFDGFNKPVLLKDAIYKKIKFSIELTLDICAIINSDLNLGTPETEDSILDNLEKKKIFNKKAVNLIREMKGFRNILVHKYGEINDKRAFETIKEGLRDFGLVIEEIESFLKSFKGK